MNFNFGEVLTRAWQITWKHKVLWIFGILAGCGQNSSRFNSRGSGSGDGGSGQIPPELQRILEFIQQNLTMVVVISCILILVIWAITIFLTTIGRIGLIRGAFHADAGAEKLIFGQLFSESTPYFWRMFGLSLLVALPILVIVAAAVAALVAFAIAADSGDASAAIGLLGMVPLLIGCFCLFIPVIFVVGLIIRQASNAIVLEDLPVLPAISRGWDVFRSNLGPIVLTGIMVAIIGLVVGLVISVPIFLIAVPGIIAFAAGNGQDWTPLIASVVGLCLYTPILWLLTGVMTTFLETIWTLTYLRLTRPPALAPVVLPEANA